MYTIVHSSMIALYIPKSKAVQASMQWQIQKWYIHTIRGIHVQCMYMYIHCMYRRICNVHTWFNQLSQQQILVGILEVYPCMYTMVDSCMIALYIPMSKAVKESMHWQIQKWCMHTICGTHVQCMYMYIHSVYRCICNVRTWFNQLSQDLSGHFGGTSL